jgi:RNA polymerase sigma-70 factor (ECF subfamily)
MTEDPFVAYRSMLFTIAYEMLGSAADAEDVLQELWLRWAEVDHSHVHNPRAYLARVVMRQALNRLRAWSRSREDYIGKWLPEPLLTSPDVAEASRCRMARSARRSESLRSICGKSRGGRAST